MPDEFTLTINLGNDAMQTREEVAEALERVAGTLRASPLPEDTQHIRDANGNAVGRWEFATRNPEPYIVADPNYGEEVVIRTENGRELRSGAGAPGDSTVTGEYARVLDAEGREQVYWDCDEWRDDPQVVMGAIVGCLLGLGDES